MKCSHLLENGKCSLVGHFYSKEGFTLNSKKACVHGLENNKECKYFELEGENDEFNSEDYYYDYDGYENDFKIEKMAKRKALE